MATLEFHLNALAEAVGADVKSLIEKNGDLTALSTTQKTNLVGAINELYSLLGSSGATIDDSGSSASVAWSASKIASELLALKNTILGGASSAYDTLKEIEALVGANSTLGATLTTAINNRVRYDAIQSLSVEQKTQALSNIGAVAVSDVGDMSVDLVAAYEAARDAT